MVYLFLCLFKIETDNSEGTGVVHAFHHGKRVSKKLKRRLTKLTISEVNALKKQSKEAVHILIYAAELVRFFIVFY